MNETETEQLYQIIFRGDRSEGWQSWKRNSAQAEDSAARRACEMEKRSKGSSHWKGGEAIIGGYRQIWLPPHPRASQIGYVPHHILVCEFVIGAFIPEPAVVHHINENKLDNRPGNLVVCENRAFHNTLHRRMRALKECGHADWLRCKFCHQWSDPVTLYSRVQKGETVSWHRACICEYKRKKREAAGRPLSEIRGARGAYGDPAAAALAACGHADWLRCQYCGVYEPPEKLFVYQSDGREKRGRHRECHLENQRKRRQAAKNAELHHPAEKPVSGLTLITLPR